MKKILLLVVIFSSFAFGQEVKLKGDFVFINGNKCFQFKSKNMMENNTFYSLDGQKLFYIDAQSTKTDSFYKIQFVGSEDYVTLEENSMSPRKEFITNLIDEEVINSKDCSINLDNFKNFKNRYHKEYREPETTVIINQNSQESSKPANGINIKIGK